MPIVVTFKWHGKSLRSKIGKITELRMQELVKELVVDVKKSISTLYPPSSQPGQPPHLRTGELHDAIDSIVFKDKSEIVGRVGILEGDVAEYGKFLEIGTSKMAPRPFLRSTILRNARKIVVKLGGRISASVMVRLRD